MTELSILMEGGGVVKGVGRGLVCPQCIFLRDVGSSSKLRFRLSVYNKIQLAKIEVLLPLSILEARTLAASMSEGAGEGAAGSEGMGSVWSRVRQTSAEIVGPDQGRSPIQATSICKGFTSSAEELEGN